MVKHIILWTLKEMSNSEKESVKAGIKEGLESLKGKIPGLVDIKVNTNGRLPSSTADLMLDSTFESEEAPQGLFKAPGTRACRRQQGSSIYRKPYLSGF